MRPWPEGVPQLCWKSFYVWPVSFSSKAKRLDVRSAHFRCLKLQLVIAIYTKYKWERTTIGSGGFIRRINQRNFSIAIMKCRAIIMVELLNYF